MPNPKKANLLDKLYRAYKEATPNTSNVTDRINTIYREGGYKGRVDRYLSNKSVNGAKKAKREIARFHEDIFPNELEIYFDENPRLHKDNDFGRAFNAVESRVGSLGSNENAAKERIARDWFEKIDGGEKPSAGWKTELNVTPMQSDPYRLNELSNNDLFYLYERTGRPEYGLEISRRHNKMVEENKKNFPYLFGEQTEK